MRLLQKVALPMLFIAAVILVGILTVQNRALRGQVRDVRDRAVQPRSGLCVPTFIATSLDGASITIGKSDNGGRQVLFFFTTTCAYCQQSLTEWHAIASAADTMPFRPNVYGISLDDEDATGRYVAANRISYPVLNFPEEKLRHLYRTRAVPVTMVLDSAGRIIYSRLGPLGWDNGVDSVLGALRWNATTTAAAHADTSER